ncbi:ISKra4 family transposase [Streptomyces sp. NBC_00873]|uniref:ISKra4 family transposase n=1 Tax=unclassified Streptomyces TaxID=2593676 RepID=UPI00386388C6|nr:ISKra4 family transposase [Streptomyces sp. NBC_00873]WSY96895.1 ISKra4 family transposase [Streptomyces sp. NBC_00873]WTA41332.1 ISKra4 family transposase [Streptomyces sp. NBC_00842]WTA48565.1 ISKra4 family transposase [Streptomyces sp. NBC_00842]
MEQYDTHATADPFACSVNAFETLMGTLSGDQASAWTHAELEEHLDAAGRELLRQLLQDHLDLRALREEEQVRAGAGLVVVGPEGRVRPWRETGHARWLASLFGLVRFTRVAHRGPGVGNVHPADEELSLPAGRHSLGLRRLAVTEAVRGSFDQAHDAVTRRCGKVLGKRRLEELVIAAAIDVDAFYRAQIPVPCSRQMPLVLQVDGKGVVMRPEALREATRRAAVKAAAAGGHRGWLAPGEKPNRKRMATVACVFDTRPAPRRPHDVIHPPGGRSGERPVRPGPRAESKWCTASLVRPPEQVIADAFDQADARDPKHLRPWIVLVDGARHQLDLITAETARRDVTVHVLLDFVHVAEYVWAAAHAFHKPGTTEAEAWAADHLTAILAGHVARTAAEMTADADREGLPATRRETVDACHRYLTGHLDQLRYDTALANGWPIATGAVEGACRHLIADRLDITGARWGLPGAEAVLRLRTLVANGDLDAYWRFHSAHEHERLYPAPGQENYNLTA